jgi:hypothetical protein
MVDVKNVQFVQLLSSWIAWTRAAVLHHYRVQSDFTTAAAVPPTRADLVAQTTEALEEAAGDEGLYPHGDTRHALFG